MTDAKTMKLVFVGIDVAMAKKKRLPISVCQFEDKKLRPLQLKYGFDKPPSGMGNKEALETKKRAEFASSVSTWLKKLQCDKEMKVVRVAIDAPSTYCDDNKNRRDSEKALGEAGISCFTTPTKEQFDQKVKKAQHHLSEGGSESKIPNANQIWMLVGFALFEQLQKDGFFCIETYPQAIVHALNCSAIHKSKKDGYAAQLESTAKATHFSSSKDLQTSLDKMGFGSRDDKLDAFLSAWVASLETNERKTYGKQPSDSIVVPNMERIAKLKGENETVK